MAPLLETQIRHRPGIRLEHLRGLRGGIRLRLLLGPGNTEPLRTEGILRVYPSILEPGSH